MPYEIRHSGDNWEVISQDSGRVVGTHPSRAKALRHLRALFANVPDAGEKMDKITLTVTQLTELTEKSELTPELSTTHRPLGTHGLWRTPSKKIPEKQQLPAYIQNIAHALLRAGHGEAEAISMAVAAVKRWSTGKGAFGHKGKVTPVVQQAAAHAVAEWEKLKASHH